MDNERRQFFRQAFSRAGKQIVRHLDDKVEAKAAHYIRPPYALAEIEFLLACTRCNACVEACPHQVIFSLSNRLGTEVMGTPALSLTSKACMLCEDYPCARVCEPGALQRDAQSAALPRLAKVSINTQTCLPYQGPECGVCVGVCPVPGAIKLVMDKPVIETTVCVGCAQCREACIVEPKAINIFSLYQKD